MTYINSHKGLGVWSQLWCIIAVLVIFAILTGCSTSKPKTEPIAPVYRPTETINLHFNRPLIIKMPVKDPATVEEHIQCGLFYFDQTRFGDAASEFEKAREKITPGQAKELILARWKMILHTTIMAYVTDYQREFLHKLENLWEKYTTTINEILAEREKAGEELSWFLGELGYE